MREFICPICGNNKFKSFFDCKNKRDNLNIVGRYYCCDNCGHYYLLEHQGIELSSQIFNGLYNDLNLFIVRKTTIKRKIGNLVRGFIKFLDGSYKLDFFINQIDKREKVIEIGCGGGRIANQLIKRGVDSYCGIDPSPNAIKQCQKIGKEEFICGTLDDVKYESDQFDVCIMENILEHVPNPQYVSNEVYRMLKPHGRFIIDVPSANSLSMKLFKKESLNPWVPFHISIFSPKSILILLRKIGFQKIIISYSTPAHYAILTYRHIKIKNGDVLSYRLKRYHLFIMFLFSFLSFIINNFKLGEQMTIVAYK